MPEVVNNALIESLTEALETTAFMTATAPEEELPSPARGILVRIDYTGPICGTIELWSSNVFAQMLTANMMGLEPDEEEVQNKSVDAVKELVNIVGGVLLTKLIDSPADMFNLTVPRADEQLDSESWGKYVAQDDVAILDVDGFPVAVRLQMNVQ